jgi:hypothetical protein
MDDEHDDYRDREVRRESDNQAEITDRETLEPFMPEVAEVVEEPVVYTPEEYELAQQIKAYRLYKEEHSRIPYTASELSHFLMKANIERPLRPDDDDLQAARRKLEGGGS